MKILAVLLAPVLLLGVFDSCHCEIIKPASSAEFQSALDRAAPGDTIQLRPMVYVGDFKINQNSDPDVPITITGDVNSTIMSEGATGLTIKGSHWIVKSLKITGPKIGILVEGKDNSLEGIVLQGIGRGIIVKGDDNKIKSCVISEAGGGMIIEGNGATLQYNSINIQAPSLVIKEDTCCGILEGNVCNGRFDLKGTMYTVKNNVANHGLFITGCDNELGGNVANGASFPKNCQNKDLGGNVYRGTGPNDTDEPSPNQSQQQNYYGDSQGAHIGGNRNSGPNNGNNNHNNNNRGTSGGSAQNSYRSIKGAFPGSASNTGSFSQPPSQTLQSSQSQSPPPYSHNPQQQEPRRPCKCTCEY